MTYDQLKVLQPADLYALIERTLHACQPDIVFPIQPAKLPEPVLCLIGDFEIRARFPADTGIPNPPCGCEYRPTRDVHGPEATFVIPGGEETPYTEPKPEPTAPLPDATDYILAHPGEFDGRAVATAVASKSPDMTGAGAPPIFVAFADLQRRYDELLKTRRDDFAMAALAGLWANNRDEIHQGYEKDAIACWAAADAMLATRTPPPTRAASPPS